MNNKTRSLEEIMSISCQDNFEKEFKQFYRHTHPSLNATKAAAVVWKIKQAMDSLKKTG